jgi:hypothetical protein
VRCQLEDRGVDEPASAALVAVRALTQNLRKLPVVDFGVGISPGSVSPSNMGAENRYDYTVIGDRVNEAARSADHAKRRDSRTLPPAARSHVPIPSSAETGCSEAPPCVGAGPSRPNLPNRSPLVRLPHRPGMVIEAIATAIDNIRYPSKPPVFHQASRTGRGLHHIGNRQKVRGRGIAALRYQYLSYILEQRF